MKNVLKTILDNGIILSLTLGMAYFFAFSYQQGKLSYYGVPIIYADLSIASVIQIFALILGALFLIVIFINAILDSAFFVKDYRARNIVSRTLFLVVILSISIAFTKEITSHVKILIIMFIASIVIDLIMPVIKVKGKDKYINKWRRYSDIVKENNKKEQELKSKSYFAKFHSSLIDVAAYVCVFLMISNWFNIAGTESAKNTEKYYIANSYSNKIIVHYTSDYYILMEETDGILDESYLIVPAAEIGEITYLNKGKLSLNKE